MVSLRLQHRQLRVATGEPLRLQCRALARPGAAGAQRHINGVLCWGCFAQQKPQNIIILVLEG